MSTRRERKLRKIPLLDPNRPPHIDHGVYVMLPYPEWLAANGVEPRPACDRWNQGEDNNDE